MEIIEFKPTKEQLAAAAGKLVPDVIAHDLKVLFAGINPGLYTAAVGHHFGRPGNRFWPVLYRAGFTPRQFSPFEDQKLIDLGYGITNVVQRASAKAEELSKAELEEGGKQLIHKVRKYKPKILAICGMGAYRTAFQKPKAQIGAQPDTIAETRIWVLPNPSGLNANFQIPELVTLFAQLKQSAEK